MQAVTFGVVKILNARFLMDGWKDGWMVGWMTCNFTSFSTVFHSYQDNGRLIIKGCVQCSSVYG